jgi:hypothetical protein
MSLSRCWRQFRPPPPFEARFPFQFAIIAFPLLPFAWPFPLCVRCYFALWLARLFRVWQSQLLVWRRDAPVPFTFYPLLPSATLVWCFVAFASWPILAHAHALCQDLIACTHRTHTYTISASSHPCSLSRPFPSPLCLLAHLEVANAEHCTLHHLDPTLMFSACA